MLETEHSVVHFGSNLDVLPKLEDNSVDSIVTDPPYELGFMGKKWDSSGIAYNVELWKECLRVLKPGGHLLSFGGTRTWHRVAVAIEDAGFEVRDSIAWMYGSGFPKSLDVAKSIELKLTTGSAAKNGFHQLNGERTGDGKIGMYANVAEQGFRKHNPEQLGAFDLDSTTPEAQQWEGWGTALKPAHEPIVVARKPLIGTVAANVLEHGTGGLNIDGSRIGTESRTDKITENGFGSNFMDDNWQPSGNTYEKTVQGRWPANVILDEYSAERLDEQSGVTSGKIGMTGKTGTANSVYGHYPQSQDRTEGIKDSGGASRFFYCPKASKTDRNEGLEELEAKAAGSLNMRTDAHSVANNMETKPAQNFHPTVKPTALMTYLINLVTPPNGTVLDPFTGSGSTGKAAIMAGFNFVGIELTEEYYPIIEGRLKHAEAKLTENKDKEGEQLF